MKKFKTFIKEAEKKEEPQRKIKWKKEEDTPSTSARGFFKSDALISDDNRWYISKTGSQDPTVRKDRSNQTEVQLYDLWWDDDAKVALMKANKLELKSTKEYPSIEKAKEAAQIWMDAHPKDY